MERKRGYYWVRLAEHYTWEIANWAYGMWTVGSKMVEPVEIDERRIVRDESSNTGKKG